MRNRAFTLIEILTVTAIVSVLAAILFPVFATAKQRAKQIVCLSNASQIGKAVLMYSNDTETYQLPGVGTYKEFLGQYGVAGLNAPGHVARPNESSDWPGYTLNSCMQSPSANQAEVSRTIAVTTRACEMWDVDTFYCEQQSTSPDFHRDYIKEHGNLERFKGFFGGPSSTRYFGGTNYVMYDGHGKWARPEQIFVPLNLGVFTRLCDATYPTHLGPADGITFATDPGESLL
jgi:prepilin-type N-terminal cleavage/methylation domain-containing protein